MHMNNSSIQISCRLPHTSVLSGYIDSEHGYKNYYTTYQLQPNWQTNENPFVTLPLQKWWHPCLSFVTLYKNGNIFTIFPLHVRM